MADCIHPLEVTVLECVLCHKEILGSRTVRRIERGERLPYGQPERQLLAKFICEQPVCTRCVNRCVPE